MRWQRFRHKAPREMYDIASEHVFPCIRVMADADPAQGAHMAGARFTIPTSGLLAKVVDLLADIPMDDRDPKGDFYEYMLGKIASAGRAGQFRKPRHIIALMVGMMAPGPKDAICDPASPAPAAFSSPPANSCATTTRRYSATRRCTGISTRG